MSFDPPLLATAFAFVAVFCQVSLKRSNYSYKEDASSDTVAKRQYNIAVKKDGKFYVGYCLEIPQARGQGNTKAEAIKDTKRAIKLCRAFLEDEKKNAAGLVTVSV